ncbi:MAG TPA: glycosyltransferase family 1 protein [Candidatus Sulfomarinibacteraceae bacterium]|nr:glycosyltransferase family 1 protein [Candidatus Sulfomarinibacteraceae bacterium]
MSERIGFDARYINDTYHGIGRYAFRLLEALVAASPRRTFVAFRGRAPDTRFDWGSLDARPNVTIVRGPWPLYWPQEQLWWPWLLRRMKIDYFHTPYFVAPLLTSAPVVITVHDMIFEQYPAYMPLAHARPYYRLLMALSVRRAARIVAVSQATARELRNFYPVSAGKIAAIGEGTDPHIKAVDDQETLQRLRRQYNLHRPFVLSVGARRPHKNLARLVRAFARLESAVPHDLVFVGQADKRFPDEARETSARLGLDGRVRFLGWVPEADLPGFYTLADAVAVPSLVEGFGLPALEAMACGAPLLAHNASSLPEVVGQAGLLVNAADCDALAQGLCRLLQDEPLREQLAAAGLKRAAEFNWRTVATQITSIYIELT